MFQFTHPCGVRHYLPHLKVGRSLFQFTHPCGVRLSKDLPIKIIEVFQFTHPCGVRHGYTRSASIHLRCFNSRTRVGCDYPTRTRPRVCRPVSIHAPVWGATQLRISYELGERVSIHAPVWGATYISLRRVRLIRRFNSRTRVGCDAEAVPLPRGSAVSIHAPVWGATMSIVKIF